MRSAGLMIVFWAALTVAVAAAPTDLSLRLLIDNPRPYVGEEVTISLQFGYTQLPADNPQVSWLGLDRFMTTELSPLLPRRENHDGQQRMIETARKQLKPLFATPAELVASLTNKDGLSASTSLTIHPQPLPNLNRPERFGGAVIKDAKLQVIDEGQGEREVVVSISGRGDLSTVELTPLLSYGDNLVPLSDELRGQIGREQSRRLRYLYQPGLTGNRPGFSTTIFDPVSASYQTLSASGATRLWITMTTTVALLLIFVAAVASFVTRRRQSDLDRLLIDILGYHPRGMTQKRYRQELQDLKFSPALLGQLLDAHQEDEERFSVAGKARPKKHSISRAELARRLRTAMVLEIDKRPRLP